MLSLHFHKKLELETSPHKLLDQISILRDVNDPMALEKIKHIEKRLAELLNEKPDSNVTGEMLLNDVLDAVQQRKLKGLVVLAVFDDDALNIEYAVGRPRDTLWMMQKAAGSLIDAVESQMDTKFNHSKG